jgi:hypothetical protein
MKNTSSRKLVRLITCIALFGGLVVASATGPLKGWQTFVDDCSVTQNACVYDENGNCLGGTKTYTPGTIIDCGAATSGTCTSSACVKGQPVTYGCCAN